MQGTGVHETGFQGYSMCLIDAQLGANDYDSRTQHSSVSSRTGSRTVEDRQAVVRASTARCSELAIMCALWMLGAGPSPTYPCSRSSARPHICARNYAAISRGYYTRGYQEHLQSDLGAVSN